MKKDIFNQYNGFGSNYGNNKKIYQDDIVKDLIFVPRQSIFSHIHISKKNSITVEPRLFDLQLSEIRFIRRKSHKIVST